MQRQIYIVDAYIVDANGGFSKLTKTVGSETITYPRAFDSKHYNHDFEKTYRKADADASEIWADMQNNEAGRQLQYVSLHTLDGVVLSGYPKVRGQLSDTSEA